ncbi:MAG: hypothetical protein H7Y20_01915, partial [Bryobacteraceae bacterium]|nr:hypothetical protein [Bryobacteraceae bacterium]
DAGFRDRDIGAIDTRELLCHTPEVDPLKGVMRYDDLFAQWISVSRRQNARPVPRLASRAALLAACGAEWPARVGVSNFGERLLLTRTGVNDRLPALWLRGRGTPALIIHPEGSEAASATPEMKALRAAGRPVLAPDVFQTGLARESRQTGGRWYLSYNRTDDANRLQDILTALRWIRSQTQDEPELVGLERAAIWVVFAAAVAPGSVSVVADLSKCTGLDEEMRECFFVPCIQRAGGLSTALRLVPKIRSQL